jgi:hypothetical protein
MATVFDNCTNEEQSSVAHFLWAKRLKTKDIHKEIVPVYGRKCVSRKAVDSWVANVSLINKEVETEVRKWLRQQPKYFCAAGCGALEKRWDKCINVGGGYVEK